MRFFFAVVVLAMIAGFAVLFYPPAHNDGDAILAPAIDMLSRSPTPRDDTPQIPTTLPDNIAMVNFDAMTLDQATQIARHYDAVNGSFSLESSCDGTQFWTAVIQDGGGQSTTIRLSVENGKVTHGTVVHNDSY